MVRENLTLGEGFTTQVVTLWSSMVFHDIVSAAGRDGAYAAR